MLGRFFPLGHQEWNLFALITRGDAWYLLLPIGELIGVVIVLYFLLRDFRGLAIVAVTSLILTTPSVVQSFF
jgi:hypothetical protein